MARIDTLERHRLGEADQWLLLRGDTASRRVLLYLHGGPGMPMFPLAEEIASAAPRLCERYLTVFWEQRGTGKSVDLSPFAHALTIDRFVADTVELAQMLASRYRVPRLHLMGHSWGSIVGALAAARRPDLFAAYIGVGQVTDFRESERRSYALAVEEARRCRDRSALRALARIGPPPHGVREVMAERKRIVRLGGNRRDKPSSLWRTLSSIARSRAYTWRDVARIVSDPYVSLGQLLPQMQTVDLFTQAPRLEMPVFILAGRHDMTVPSSLVEEYFDRLDAPAGKHLIWFERSAHVPFLEEAGKFELLMCTTVAHIADPHREHEGVETTHSDVS